MMRSGLRPETGLSRVEEATFKLAGAHLKALKEARLVQSRRDGKRMLYRLSGRDIAHLGVTLRQVAEEHLLELRLALQQMVAEPDRPAKVECKTASANGRRPACR